jgi:hypothetical protein
MRKSSHKKATVLNKTEPRKVNRGTKEEMDLQKEIFRVYH